MLGGQLNRQRIALLIVDAAATGEHRELLERVPVSVRQQLAEVLVYPGASRGESQIRGFKHAIEHGYDLVAVLSAGGQDAPEALPELLAPLSAGEADAVFAVAAPALGAPPSESLANRLLSRLESTLLGTSFGEFNPS